MPGALKKTMVYLGFAEDDRYRDYYEADEYDEVAEAPEAAPVREADIAPLPRRTNVARLVREDPMGALSRITTIHPRTYNEAKTIGENFRDGVPVIMNLTDMSDADAKRLVDFAAGLVFGLHGSIERVTAKVFLLSPAHVEVLGEESVPETPRELFNQS